MQVLSYAVTMKLVQPYLMVHAPNFYSDPRRLKRVGYVECIGFHFFGPHLPADTFCAKGNDQPLRSWISAAKVRPLS